MIFLVSLVLTYSCGIISKFKSSRIGLGKVSLTNEGFRKLTEVSVNDRLKQLIFKTLTERISRF